MVKKGDRVRTSGKWRTVKWPPMNGTVVDVRGNLVDVHWDCYEKPLSTVQTISTAMGKDEIMPE
jgi:hypothetical protein